MCLVLCTFIISVYSFPICIYDICLHIFFIWRHILRYSSIGDEWFNWYTDIVCIYRQCVLYLLYLQSIRTVFQFFVNPNLPYVHTYFIDVTSYVSVDFTSPLYTQILFNINQYFKSNLTHYDSINTYRANGTQLYRYNKSVDISAKQDNKYRSLTCYGTFSSCYYGKLSPLKGPGITGPLF